ncbi:hypothetical protein AAEZ63_13505, partial [Myroides sp. C2723]
LGEFVKDNQKYTSVTAVSKTATTGKGLSIDTKEAGKDVVTFTETVTTANRFVKGAIANVTDADAKFTYYKYIDELGTERFITVSQDVSNDFETIINDNKTILEEFITNTTGDVKVIEKEGDIIFVVKEGDSVKEINITEIIKENTFVASLANETVNESGVKAGFTFNNGKDTENVKFAETLTGLSQGRDAKNYIEYSYTDETGKAASTKITVTQDVINTFPEIIKDSEVIREIEKIITDKRSDISIVKEGDNYKITYVTENGTETIDLGEFVKDNQKYTSVTAVSKTATTGKGLTIDTKEAGKDVITFTETVTTANRFVKGAIANVTDADAKFTYYKYIDELGTERFITVSQDVSNDFETIINDNKTILEEF